MEDDLTRLEHNRTCKLLVLGMAMPTDVAQMDHDRQDQVLQYVYTVSKRARILGIREKENKG